MLSSARRYMTDRISPKENDTPVSNNSSNFRRPKFKFANAFSRRKNRSSPAAAAAAAAQQAHLQKQSRRHFKKQDSPLSPEPLVMAIKSVTSCRDSKKGIDFTPMSPMGEKKLKMMPKIAEYRGKGYLNAAQERELYAKLEQPKENPFDSSTVNEVGRKLEEYRRLSFVDRSKDHHNDSGHDNDAAVDKLPTVNKNNNNKSFLTDLLKKDNQILANNTTTGTITRAHHIKEDEWTYEDERPYNELPLNDRVILDVKQVYNQADEDFTQSLFVEMCFFARLGFIQPPTCLRCLYMESMEGMDEDLHCTNYVIWRRNANILLHPETLEHNLCLVECQAARQLVDGQEVQNHFWDSIKQKLVYIEPGRLSVA